MADVGRPRAGVYYGLHFKKRIAVPVGSRCSPHLASFATVSRRRSWRPLAARILLDKL